MPVSRENGLDIYYEVTGAGPPLAVLLSNQGYTKREFRAALGFVRVAESQSFAEAARASVLTVRESMVKYLAGLKVN